MDQDKSSKSLLTKLPKANAVYVCDFVNGNVCGQKFTVKTTCVKHIASHFYVYRTNPMTGSTPIKTEYDEEYYKLLKIRDGLYSSRSLKEFIEQRNAITQNTTVNVTQIAETELDTTKLAIVDHNINEDQQRSDNVSETTEFAQAIVDHNINQIEELFDDVSEITEFADYEHHIDKFNSLLFSIEQEQNKPVCSICKQKIDDNIKKQIQVEDIMASVQNTLFKRTIPHKQITIPNNAIDMRLFGEGFLWTDYNHQMFYQIPTFNLWNTPEFDVENRVAKMPNNLFAQQVPLTFFENNQQETRSYLNIVNKRNELELVIKYTIENNVLFSGDILDADYVQYDIETTSQKMGVPELKDCQAFISMISTVRVSQKTGEINCIVYVLNKYKYDTIKIEQTIQQQIEKFKQHENPSKQDLKYANTQFSLQIKQYQFESYMCTEFLTDLNYIKKTTFLIGFNSNTAIFDRNAKDFKPIGYDLPWIINRSQLKINQEIGYGIKLFDDKLARTIKHIDILPHVYCLDAMPIFMNHEYFKMGAKKRSGNRLDDFLKYANIPCKLTHDYLEQAKRLYTQDEEVSDIIAYCLWDSFSLHFVLDKIQHFIELREAINLYKVPLSVLLFRSVATSIKIMILREFYQRRYMVTYAPICDYIAPKQLIGATTEKCPQQFIQQVLEIIGLGDYQSLYPNANVSNHISPENQIDVNDPDAYVVDITYQDEYLIEQNKIDIENKVKGIKPMTLYESCLVAFSKTNKGIIPELIEKLLQNRLEIKAQMKSCTEDQYPLLNAKQQSIKIFANTLYGITGQPSSYFYNINCAMACTSIARQMCYYAKKALTQLGFTVIFRDTDSSGILIKNIETIQSDWKIVNDLIYSFHKDKFAHRFQFILEIDNIQISTYYPHQKKAYAREESKLSDILKFGIQNAPKETTIKGVSWGVMSMYQKDEIYRIFNLILQIQGVNHIAPLVNTFIAYHKNRLTTAINQLQENVNVSENRQIIYQYAKRQRYSNKRGNGLSKFLELRYNIVQECFIIPYKTTSKKTNECWFPCDQIQNGFDYKNIDVTRTINLITSGVRKFFGEVDPHLQDVNCDLVDDIDVNLKDGMHLLIKLAGQFGYERSTQLIEQINIEQFVLNNSAKSVMEYIYQTHNKLFFDVDDCKLDTNKFKIIDLIRSWVIKLSNQYVNFNIHMTQTTNKRKLHSYHIVCDVKCSLNLNLFIAQQINTELKFDAIDLGLYGKRKTLRLPYSKKFDKDQNKIVDYVHVIISTGSKFNDFLITDVSNCEISLPESICFDKDVPFEIGNNLEITQQHLQIIQDWLVIQNLQAIFKTKSQCTTIEVINKPYTCPVCKSLHNSDNMFASVQRTMVQINCFSNCRKKKDQREMTIKLQLPQQLLDKTKYSRTQKLDNQIEKLQQNEFTQAQNFVWNSPTDGNKTFQIPIDNITMQDVPEVDYNIDYSVIFVKSSMGTAKSKRLLKLLEQFVDKRILVLSFRKTYARDYCGKLKLTNYEDVEGELNLIKYPHMIIQVDSLSRYRNVVDPDILVIDECESIMEQMISIKRYTNAFQVDSLIGLLKRSKQLICLDAFLEPKTIQNMLAITQTDNYHVFINNYKLKKDHDVIVVPYSTTSSSDIGMIIDRFSKEAKAGKKIIGLISHPTLLKQIEQRLIAEEIRIKIYNTESGKLDETGKSQAKYKKEDFADVNKVWVNFQVILYTSTLTCGVSFEEKHFDLNISVYGAESCSPLGFIQGIGRVRDLSQKQMIIYFENKFAFELYTPAQLMHINSNLQNRFTESIVFDLSETGQFMVWLDARTGAQKRFRCALFFRYLFDTGYQILIQNMYKIDQQTTNPVQLHSKDCLKISQVKLTDDDFEMIQRTLKSEQLQCDITDPDFQTKFEKMCLANQYKLNAEQINELTENGIKYLYANKNKIADYKTVIKAIQRVDFTNSSEITVEQIKSVADYLISQNQMSQLATDLGTVNCKNRQKFIQTLFIVTKALDLMAIIQQDIRDDHEVCNLSIETITKCADIINKDQDMQNFGISINMKNSKGIKSMNTIFNKIGYQIKQTLVSRTKTQKKYSYELLHCDIQTIVDQAKLLE